MTKIIDVSNLTQAGPVDLLLQVEQNSAFGLGPGGLAAAPVFLFGDEQFKLSQTRKEYRPADARDDTLTSGCAGGASGDNCHPLFTVEFTGWRSLPPWSFSPDFHVAYEVKLDHPSQIAGQPVTGWLKGASTNSDGSLMDANGNPTRDDEGYADYILEQQNDDRLGAPDQGGLHVATASPIDYSTPVYPYEPVKVVVTSRDYGGSAILRPTATITGAGFVGSVTDPGFPMGYLLPTT